MVPRPIHDKDFRLELISWASCSCLLLISRWLARIILDERTWEHNGPPREAYRQFAFASLAQLVFSAFLLFNFLIRSL
jgi:hypothetical protein